MSYNDYKNYQKKWLEKHIIEVGSTVTIARGWEQGDYGYRKATGQMPVNLMIGRKVKVLAINADCITVEITSKLGDRQSFRVPCFILEEV